ncbi:hypothetical protein E5288_WYG001476 [Bos mutus]|uniref:Uncharacterized protein n=1 Tax=Bos mutus TaxID=72004 RepID=A0A6B0R209_9CETA|nr:hypothetical protein [Bos mutus]
MPTLSYSISIPYPCPGLPSLPFPYSDHSVMKSFVYFKIVLVEKGWYFEAVVENSHKLKSQGPQLVLERTFQNKNLQNDISNEHKTPLKDVKLVRMENRNQIRHFERSKCRTKAKSDMKRKFWTIEMNGWINQKIHNDTLDLQKWFCLCDYSFNA